MMRHHFPYSRKGFLFNKDTIIFVLIFEVVIVLARALASPGFEEIVLYYSQPRLLMRVLIGGYPLMLILTMWSLHRAYAKGVAEKEWLDISTEGGMVSVASELGEWRLDAERLGHLKKKGFWFDKGYTIELDGEVLFRSWLKGVRNAAFEELMKAAQAAE